MTKRDVTIHPASRAQIWWYSLMAAGGLLFGALGERRPFGTDVLAHPVIVFFAAAGAGLVILRLALARPVPELISERALVLGFLAGGAAFLAANWVVTVLVTIR